MKLMESYEMLLDSAYKKVKKVKSSGANGRFDVPEVKVEINGNKTVILNFAQIASYIRRKPENLCKFLSNELASYCKPEGDRLVLNRRLSREKIDEKLKQFVNKFVLCHECKKPDTELIKQEGFTFIHCLACGAKHSLGKI